VVALPIALKLRTLNGIFLASVKLGRSVEAGQVFGKLVVYGFNTGQWGESSWAAAPTTPSIRSTGRRKSKALPPRAQRAQRTPRECKGHSFSSWRPLGLGGKALL